MRRKRVLKNLAGNMCIICSVALLIIFILDYFNPFMDFLGHSRIVLYLLCISSVYLSVCSMEEKGKQGKIRKRTGDGSMLEIGIRTFLSQKGTRISNDYREQMKLIKRWMNGKINSSLRETDSTAIYQYYSMAPFYCTEARFLRRMQAGVSVMYMKQSVEDYLKQIKLPGFLKKILNSYMRIFLNSLDYIVVNNERIKETLRKEGIVRPHFYMISAEEGKESLLAGRWLDFYQSAAYAAEAQESLKIV